MVGIEKVLAHCKGFARGQHAEHQIVTDPGQADLAGIEIGQANGVEVVVGATGVVDHIQAIALGETVGVAAASTQEPVIAGTAIQGVVIAVAQ
ncbi:hypothetical protein D3C76_585570 [compost metagenome]